MRKNISSNRSTARLDAPDDASAPAGVDAADVLVQLFAQPGEIQALVLAQLDTDFLADLASAQAWPSELGFGQALADASRDRFKGRLAPIAARLAPLPPAAAGALTPNWRQRLAQQQELVREVRRAAAAQAADANAPCLGSRALALELAQEALAEVLAAVGQSADTYAAEAELIAPWVRAQRAQNRRVQGCRALHLLGLSGGREQASRAGRLVAAASAAYLGHRAETADLFKALWSESMALWLIDGALAPKARDNMAACRTGLSILAPMRRAAQMLGDADLYAQSIALAHALRLPRYGEAFESSGDMRQAMCLGHVDLVAAMLTARGDAYTPSELEATVTATQRALSAWGELQAPADADHLAAIAACIAQVTGAAAGKKVG